jgi:hypothetical protein
MAYTTINKPNQYFDTQLWTGNNGNGRTFTGLNFQPDYVWVKCYNSSNYYQMMVDRVRGGNYFLATAITAAEDNKSHGEITSWNSDGTTWIDGTNATYPRLYYNDGVGSAAGGSEYVAWQFKAGNSAGSSNTAGSITSTVSANTTAGFSIVSYTGNGTSGASIGHGLGSTPAMIICKSRSDAEEWATYHQSLTYTKYIVLNSTAAAVSTARFYQAPTSSLFYVDNGYGVNKSSATYIAYCFAEKKGYSKFGSYTGNGSTDGTFVYTGFKPAFVMIKLTSSAGEGWEMIDNKRSSFNVANKFLRANSATDQTTNTDRQFDMLSNGIKMRGSHGSTNGSGSTYIYMAFAENPFVSSAQIPTTAR